MVAAIRPAAGVVALRPVAATLVALAVRSEARIPAVRAATVAASHRPQAVPAPARVGERAPLELVVEAVLPHHRLHRVLRLLHRYLPRSISLQTRQQSASYSISGSLPTTGWTKRR